MDGENCQSAEDLDRSNLVSLVDNSLEQSQINVRVQLEEEGTAGKGHDNETQNDEANAMGPTIERDQYSSNPLICKTCDRSFELFLVFNRRSEKYHIPSKCHTCIKTNCRIIANLKGRVEQYDTNASQKLHLGAVADALRSSKGRNFQITLITNVNEVSVQTNDGCNTNCVNDTQKYISEDRNNNDRMLGTLESSAHANLDETNLINGTSAQVHSKLNGNDVDGETKTGNIEGRNVSNIQDQEMQREHNDTIDIGTVVLKQGHPCKQTPSSKFGYANSSNGCSTKKSKSMKKIHIFKCETCSGYFSKKKKWKNHECIKPLKGNQPKKVPKRKQTDKVVVSKLKKSQNKSKPKQFAHCKCVTKHTKECIAGSTCNICGKIFKHRSYLRTHMVIHTGQKPYQCKICLKSYSNCGTLWKHKQIHQTTKPFQCAKCPRRFYVEIDARRHAQMHKIRTCNVCQGQFMGKRELMKHWSKHHKLSASRS